MTARGAGSLVQMVSTIQSYETANPGAGFRRPLNNGV